MAHNIGVQHKQQLEDGYCLPACAEMVLTYWDVALSQHKISRTLKLRPGLGAPASNILFLRSPQVDVAYFIGSTLDRIALWLDNGIPIIAFVQAGELPHWQSVHVQHWDEMDARCTVITRKTG